ncbi:MAG: hypothetical protein RL264_2276 [Bacteroidota bacterium]|jgi:Ca-activated chloride channel family protein
MTKLNFPLDRGVLRLILLVEAVSWLLFAILYYSILGLGSSPIFFVKPENFYLLSLLLPLIYLFLFSENRRKVLQQHLTLFSKDAVPEKSEFWIGVRYFLFRSAFVCLVLAMTQPVYGKKKVKGSTKTMELVICLDISNSMNTKDIDDTPRLEIAKRAMNQLVNKMSGEKIGLCVFAGDAFVQLPLTNDYGAVKLFINEINTSYVSTQGTNIPAALTTALEMFTEQKLSKAILLITDGENHESEDESVYNAIIDKNIQTCVLGIGTKTGGYIPRNPDDLSEGFVTDNGSKVVSVMNPAFVERIADKTNGVSLVTSEPYPDVDLLLTEINRLKRMKSRNLNFEIMSSQYHIPLLGAFVSWLLWLFLPMLKWKKTK